MTEFFDIKSLQLPLKKKDSFSQIKYDILLRGENNKEARYIELTNRTWYLLDLTYLEKSYLMGKIPKMGESKYSLVSIVSIPKLNNVIFDLISGEFIFKRYESLENLIKKPHIYIYLFFINGSISSNESERLLVINKECYLFKKIDEKGNVSRECLLQDMTVEEQSKIITTIYEKSINNSSH